MPTQASDQTVLFCTNARRDITTSGHPQQAVTCRVNNRQALATESQKPRAEAKSQSQRGWGTPTTERRLRNPSETTLSVLLHLDRMSQQHRRKRPSSERQVSKTATDGSYLLVFTSYVISSPAWAGPGDLLPVNRI
nr:uncharacterized protein LOC129526895 [Gorilla gorilla gorilla]